MTPLTWRAQRDGSFRPTWYGEYKDGNGKRRIINTGVKWQGIPPSSGKLRDTGDAAFERTREKVVLKLDTYRDEIKHKGNAAHLVERLIEAKTGRAVEHVKLADLADRWLSGPRKSAISARHAKVTRSAFTRFAAFMATRNRKAVYVYEVTAGDSDAHIEELRRTLAPRTSHGHAALLRSAFKRFLPVGAANPFDGFGGREKNSSGVIHRRPFTAAEIQALITASADDAMMRDLITAAACTGLRRGDLCNLRWSDVDMTAGMVTVKASKTGEPVEVPLFPPLRGVLESRERSDSGFVFPEAAQMLAKNPCGLSYRFKRIAARALDTKTPEPVQEITEASTIETAAVKAIQANVGEGPRQERILNAFRHPKRVAGGAIRT